MRRRRDGAERAQDQKGKVAKAGTRRPWEWEENEKEEEVLYIPSMRGVHTGRTKVLKRRLNLGLRLIFVATTAHGPGQGFSVSRPRTHNRSC